MAVVVVNVGMFERDTNGRRTTNITKGTTDQGTVRVWVEGQQYVFGPGERKTIADDGIAAAVIAADGRLRAADTRDGLVSGGAS